MPKVAGKRRPRRKGVKGKGWKDDLQKFASVLNKAVKDSKVLSKQVIPQLAKKYNAGGVADIAVPIVQSLGYGKRKQRRVRKKGMRGKGFWDDVWSGFKWGTGFEPLKRLFGYVKKETGVDLGGVAGTVAGEALAGPGGAVIGGALGSAMSGGRKRRNMKGGFNQALPVPNSSTTRGAQLIGGKKQMRGKASPAQNYPNASSSRGQLIKF